MTAKKFITRPLLSVSKHSIELKADTPAFENISLKPDEILEIWEVGGLWTRHLTPPAFL